MTKELTRPCRIVSEHLSSHGDRTLVTAGITNVAWLSPSQGCRVRYLDYETGVGDLGVCSAHLREGIFSNKAIASTINTGALPAGCESQHARHEHKCRHTRAPCRTFFQDTPKPGRPVSAADSGSLERKGQGERNFRRRWPFILTVRIGNECDLARWRVYSVNNSSERKRGSERDFERRQRS